MSSELLEFSSSQWGFLAVLEAFGKPVSIDIVGAIAPLSPGSLVDLVQRTKEQHLISQTDKDLVALSQNLPVAISKRLGDLNTPAHLSVLFDRLKEKNLLRYLDLEVVAHLLARAERDLEAASIERKIAGNALRSRDLNKAMHYLNQAVNRHSALGESRERSAFFLSDILELSNLSVATGRSLTEILPLLQKGRTLANRSGDRRSLGLIDLHLGRFFYFSERRIEALAALSSGRSIVEELGDDDILSQSAEFLGLYFFTLGHYPQAIKHFERASILAEQQKSGLINPLAPLFMSFSAAYLGEFHRAIGIIDSNWRSATQRQEQGLAATFRAALGHMLLMVNKKRDALFHLYRCLQEAMAIENALAIYLAKAGLSYYHFLDGRLREARDILAQAQEEAAGSGIIRQYNSAWMLEMLFEFDRLGFEPIPDFSFMLQTKKIMEGPSVHLQGVALRLQARKAADKGEKKNKIKGYLKKSEDLLSRSGDPVQLAKTKLEIARLKLDEGDRNTAYDLAQRAWQGLSGYAEELFPDDLRYLLESQNQDRLDERYKAGETVIERFFEMMDEFVPSADLNELLGRAVRSTNRFFGAERGGLFWFKSSDKKRKPYLRVGVNLAEDEVSGESFKSQLSLIISSFRDKRPLVIRRKAENESSTGREVLSMLCLPVEVQGQIRGVLYHDNSYLDDCFDFLDESLLIRLARHLSISIGRIWDYGRLMEERSRMVSEKSTQGEQPDTNAFLGQCAGIAKLFDQVEQVAQSESIVLLIGETGVGKELLARKVHNLSPRREGPYVIVDATTIPENLLESELFGHEKGAFTGADRRKLGRLELAHSGTLFLDEVGELSVTMQSKLLRVLDQKTFVRIGGTRELKSDFRLVTATNRELGKDIESGRFREDLYYRLNVVPLYVPPLRDRKEDVLLLARYFLNHFAREFGRPPVRLTRGDEEKLMAYHWPGNVRELRNVMERAALLSRDGRIELDRSTEAASSSDNVFEDNLTLDEVQRCYIQHVLRKAEGRISGPGGAAEKLGMKRTSLYSRMKKLGLT